MPSTDNNQANLRHLPKVHALLETEPARALLAAQPRPVVLDEVRAELDALRRKVLAGEAAPPFDEAGIFEAIKRRLAANDQRRLQRVINATGIVIHTNMGRAPMAEAAVAAVTSAARNYSNLELDLESGKRGGRGGQIGDLLKRLTGAEAALVVNNNAAAVLLALTAVAAGGEVVISRGELVEIGGGFRVPDVITQSGARLVEVGTTNKTRLGDYKKAVTAETKVLLKVHASNYRIVGFTEETALPELAALGREHGLLVMNDLGSGALVDVTRFGLPYEPTVSETIKAGADVAMVSGDKLLGGPQCGILLGKKEPIARMASHPLFRALRADKLTLAALEATLQLYEDDDRLTVTVPVLHMLSRSKEELTRRARRLRNALAKVPGLETRLVDGVGYTGGGALPTVPLPTKLVQVRCDIMTIEALAAALRRHDPPVMGMLADGWLVLDVRTVREDEMKEIIRAFSDVSSGGRMLPIYNLVALCFACIFTGGAVALLFCLATTWRRQRKMRSSRQPFQGVDPATLPEPARQMVQDALALRARKPDPSWHVLIITVLSFALAYKFYGHVFHHAIPAALPMVTMSWPSLLMTMGFGFCLIPVVGMVSVKVACRKVSRNLHHAPGVEPAV